MIRIAAAVLILGFVSCAQAAPIDVRSGEHPGFSRLVFEFPVLPEWALVSANGGYELRISGASQQFDFSQVFRFIPRKRLTDIQAQNDGRRVVLTLGCVCHAVASVHAGTKLVVDIRDGPEPAPEEDREIASFQMPASPDLPAMPHIRLIGQFTAMDDSADETIIQAAALPIDDSVSDSSEINEMRKVLLREFGRAAAQGLISVDLAPAPPKVQENPAADKAEPPPEIPDSSRHMFGLEIVTSMDRDRPDLAAPDGAADICMSDDRFDFAVPHSERSAADIIARGRSNLLGEFDRVDPANLSTLVKGYLYLGFGAEARAMIRAFGMDLSDANLFLRVADIMDGDDLTGLGPLRGQTGCDGKVALWSALDVAMLPSETDINKNAILSAFSELPLHLRRHLGPGLAEKFIARNDLETATTIRDAISRAGGDPGDRFRLMHARLQSAGGQQEEASGLLRDVASQDSENAAAALLALINFRLESGQPVLPSDAEHIAAVAFEHRNTEFGQKLARAAVLAHASNGEYESAFLVLKQADNQIRGEIETELLHVLAEKAPDAPFLISAFGYLDDPSRLEAGLRAAFSKRLQGLGFPGEAARLSGKQHVDEAAVKPTAQPDKALTGKNESLAEPSPPPSLADANILIQQSEHMRNRILSALRKEIAPDASAQN